MALSDIKTFIEDILVRYDPDIDLSEGSKAQTELVLPIADRIGTDPFDDDIQTFIMERVRQTHPNNAIAASDELMDLLINPMRVILEPVVREVKLVKLRGDISNVEKLADEEVDALMSNFFEARRSGGISNGVVRIYFAAPQSVSVTLVNPATTRGGLRFAPTRPQQITSDQMLLNVDGSEYYFDVNYSAESRGSEYNVEAGEIVSVAGLPSATRVRNIRRFRGGIEHEKSLDFIARVERGRTDKTMTTDPGIQATLRESFPAIRRLFTIGFRDPEMKRDVIKGGSLGPVPDPDVFGPLYGEGTVVDDLDADLTSPIITSSTGNFLSRLGAAGTVPDGWYVTLVYTDGALVVVDALITQVVSATQIRTEHEAPVLVGGSPTPVTWMLRRKKLTVTDIPGGIALPDSADGSIEITSDEIHIGGKTDIYVAGETEQATSRITSLTDEEPLAAGIDAETNATATVVLHDIALDFAAQVERGMSLVLEEGADADSYRIIDITSLSPMTVVLDVVLTGTQSNLLWKVVDTIDVELTDPKDVKVEGDDLILAAGTNTATTAGATNFLDANVLEGDILRIEHEEVGGDYVVTAPGAVSLEFEPAASRTLVGVPYRIFRRSEGVNTPVVRVKSLELLDGSGAPSGTKIPYKEVVLAASNGFQNEGSGAAFDGLIVTGLVTSRVAATTGVYVIGGLSLNWSAHDPENPWDAPITSGVINFTVGSKTAAALAAELNSNVALDSAAIKAVVLTKGGFDYVGIVTTRLVRITGGTSLSALGWDTGSNNAQIQNSPGQHFGTDNGVRVGDVVEVVDGNNAATFTRIVNGPEVLSGSDRATVGTGPRGPLSLSAKTDLYNLTVLRPDVDARARIGRASVGSVRVYFLDPTSAEFDYAETLATVQNSVLAGYRPDPENSRSVMPALPLTDLPNTAATSPTALTDTSVNFFSRGVKAGDLVDLLYVPIDGTSALPSPADIAFTASNNTLKLRLGDDPFITIVFPFAMSRQDAVDFINEAVGVAIASLGPGNQLRLAADSRIELDPTSTAIAHVSNPLFLAAASMNSDHPDKGTYIIGAVAATSVTFSTQGAVPAGSVSADVRYQIRRYLQRVSSTEMNENLDASGLYFFDVQMISLAPGDEYNTPSGTPMTISGYRSDGYRLRSENSATTFSRAEVLWAEISRSILLVGSSDNPEEAVQLSRQNVQVDYDRSQIVDDVQSFCDSRFKRVLCTEPLSKHLLPHYVSFSWYYVGGASESEMLRAIEDELDSVEPNQLLEVSDLTSTLRQRGATSVYSPDATSVTGRTAPLFVVIYHDVDRNIRGYIVKDFVDTVRTQRYLPGTISVRRVSSGGITR